MRKIRSKLILLVLCVNAACFADKRAKTAEEPLASDNPSTHKDPKLSEKTPAKDQSKGSPNTDQTLNTDPGKVIPITEPEGSTQSTKPEKPTNPKPDTVTNPDTAPANDEEPETIVVPEPSRDNPPPRAQFAEEDLKMLKPLYYAQSYWKSANLPMAYKKIAEIFQFDGFRTVPVERNADNSEPYRVLLLSYTVDHLEETINFFAALAKCISEDDSKANQRKLTSFYPVPVVSLQHPAPAEDGTFSIDHSRILVNIDKAHSKFIKRVPLSEKMQKFWPEALQLELSFGSERIIFIFPSIFRFWNGLSAELLEGKILLQTPWILRALEGETLNAVWQAVSRSDIDDSAQTGSLEELRRTNPNLLFETIWDARSDFFPKDNAFRVRDRFSGPGKDFPGSRYLGYKDLKLETVGQFRFQITDLNTITPFTFENKHSIKGN